MIRILIIDDQKSVVQTVKNLIEPKKELAIVGIAENGEQGIEKVKQLKPDIAIIDLYMPTKNGMATTYFITQNYPETKVIILTVSDGQMLNQAILLGAKGYLLKNSLKEELIASIYAAQRNSIYLGKNTLERLQMPAIEEQTAKLDQINLLIAKEIINCWRKYSCKTLPTVQQIIKSLSLDEQGLNWMKDYLCQEGSSDFTLTQKLETIANQIFTQVKNSPYTHFEVIEKKQQIAQWFNNSNSQNHKFQGIGLRIIHQNYQFLRTITLEKLQKLLSVLWQQTAPLALLKTLRSLIKHLSNLQHFFASASKQSVAKEKSAENSFFHLANQLSKPQVDYSPNQQEIYQRAIVFIYQCKINTEVNNLLARLLLEIKQKLKFYLDILSKTDQLLWNLNQKLESPQSINLITHAQISEQLQKQELPCKLRYDFEQWTGHSLNQWGMYTVDLELEIKNRLLEKLKPITQELYSDLCRDILALSLLKYAQ